MTRYDVFPGLTGNPSETPAVLCITRLCNFISRSLLLNYVYLPVPSPDRYTASKIFFVPNNLRIFYANKRSMARQSRVILIHSRGSLRNNDRANHRPSFIRDKKKKRPRDSRKYDDCSAITPWGAAEKNEARSRIKLYVLSI